MKRSFAFFALVCAILFGCTATAGAQSKALKKDVKKRVKELTKEGWKPLASSSTVFGGVSVSGTSIVVAAISVTAIVDVADASLMAVDIS